MTKPGSADPADTTAPESHPDFAPLARLLRDAEQPPLAIAGFARHWARLRRGESGQLREEEIEAVGEVEQLDALAAYAAAGRAALARCAIIKLNGGLATTMGLERAKSLLPVKNGLSFLDITVRHLLHLRRQTKVPIPLFWMHSFRTRDDCRAALAAYPHLNGSLPLDFLQHSVPKLDAATHTAIHWPRDPACEWCPPGHGDCYLALQSSGLLDRLLAAGFHYAFISNADNLGATPEPRILGWLTARRLSFVAEVTARSHGDRKGGHIARRRSDGRLVLREAAQCAPADRHHFEDIARHPYFNANNLWIDLRALARRAASQGGLLQLPLIQNEKTVDPRDPDSPPVLQLETALGAAIEIFEAAAAVAVPRSRFAPVKTTADLLAVRSDAYQLSDDDRIVPTPHSTAQALRIDLDPRFYRKMDDFEQRFADGPPSLRRCRSLRLRGDIAFGADVVIEGDVDLHHPGPGQRRIPPRTCLATP